MEKPKKKQKTKAMVRVKPASRSKIIWTQVAGFVASWAGAKGFNMDADTQVAFVLFMQGLVGLLTWVWRVWFNATVPPSSL